MATSTSRCSCRFDRSVTSRSVWSLAILKPKAFQPSLSDRRATSSKNVACPDSSSPTFRWGIQWASPMTPRCKTPPSSWRSGCWKQPQRPAPRCKRPTFGQPTTVGATALWRSMTPRRWPPQERVDVIDKRPESSAKLPARPDLQWPVKRSRSWRPTKRRQNTTGQLRPRAPRWRTSGA
jgi:hypothetical protein